MKKIFFLAVMVMFVSPGIDAQENFLTAPASLSTSIPFQGFYSAIDISHDGKLYALAGDSVFTLDVVTGNIMDRKSVTGNSYAGYPAFLSLDPENNDIWLGYTTFENADDRIYKYDAALENWTHIASFPGNFDLAIRNGEALVSGLNSSDFNDPNGIWLLDKSGANEHRMLIETGGYSSGLDVDNEGNIIYASSFFSDNALLLWGHAIVTSAIDSQDDTLKIEDASILTDMPAGAYDLDLDSSNNIIFNCNNFIENFIAMWDGKNSYDTLATTDQFLTKLAAHGDLSLNEIESKVFAMAFGTIVAEVHFDIPQTSHSLFANGTLKAYPNPSIDFVRISTQEPESGIVSVYNSRGSIVHREFYYNSDEEINISALKPGNYLVVLKTYHQTYSAQILKK